MIALACFLALAAATRVDLVDEVYSIPADKWHYVDVGLKQRPALVLARFDSPDSASVRLALMRREDMEHLFDGLPYGVVNEVGPGRSGTLRARVPRGDYVVVVDNRENSGRPATVHLRVWLDFSGGPAKTQISPERQLAVIVISFAVFFGIVGYSMSRLWRSFQGHR
jgi:hypothetical protein